MTDKTNKKKRKAIDLEMKMKIIKQHESGKTVSNMSFEHKLSHSTISTIIKNKERIREAIDRSASMKSTIITKKRNGPIHKMENFLKIWMENLIQNGISLNFETIQTKALSLLEDLKEKEGESYNQNFSASIGWFERFKKRENLQNLKICAQAASADSEADEIFKKTYQKIFDEEKDPIYIEELRISDLLEIQELCEEDEPPKKFVLKEMTSAFSQINEALKVFEKMDSDKDRFMKVQRNIHQALACYDDIYDEKKKKTVEKKLKKVSAKSKKSAMNISSTDDDANQ